MRYLKEGIMSIETVSAIVKALAEEYAKREQAKEDNARAQKIIKEVISLVNKTRDQIIDYLDKINQSKKIEQYDGACNSWERYDGDDEDLLNAINLKLDDVEGAVRGVYESDLSKDLKINLFPRYMIVVGFRSIALSEYKHKYAKTVTKKETYTNAIRNMWKRSRDNWSKVEPLIKEKNRSRFSSAETSGSKGGRDTEPCTGGYYEVYYIKDGQRIVVEKVEAEGRAIGNPMHERLCHYKWPVSPEEWRVKADVNKKMEEDILYTYKKDNDEFISFKNLIERSQKI